MARRFGVANLILATAMLPLNNYVNGNEVRSRATSTTTIIDPVTGRAYATAPKSNAADVDAAFMAATQAFTTWKETTPAERQLLLLKIADALMAHKDELAAAECKNCGKPRQLTIDEELVQGADQIRFFAGAVRHVSNPTRTPRCSSHAASRRGSAASWRARRRAAT